MRVVPIINPRATEPRHILLTLTQLHHRSDPDISMLARRRLMTPPPHNNASVPRVRRTSAWTIVMWTRLLRFDLLAESDYGDSRANSGSLDARNGKPQLHSPGYVQSVMV